MRVKYTEVLKFLLAFMIGVTVKTIYDLRFPFLNTDCTQCVRIHCQKPFESDDIVRPELQVQLREPFKPQVIGDVIPYQYFTGKYLYDNVYDGPVVNLRGHERADIQDILRQAMSLFNSVGHHRKELSRLVNGYRRFDPLRGEEFILDVEITDKVDVESPLPVHRLHLVKPVTTAQLIEKFKQPAKPMVTICLPVFIKNETDLDRINTFISYYKEVFLKRNELVTLMVVLFVDETSKFAQLKGKDVKKNFLNLKLVYEGVKVRVIETHKPFSRTLGLDLATKQFSANSLLFFADLDVQIMPEFLDRCRSNAVSGSVVYYPVPFSLYNSSMVLKFTPPGYIHSIKDLTSINSYTGRWAVESYSMVCLYRKDYDNVGGLDLNQKAWGGEDRSLYRKHVLNQNIKVMRSMDPGIIHHYNQKYCKNVEMSVDQQLLCNITVLHSYASQEQLARKVLFS